MAEVSVIVVAESLVVAAAEAVSVPGFGLQETRKIAAKAGSKRYFMIYILVEFRQ